MKRLIKTSSKDNIKIKTVKKLLTTFSLISFGLFASSMAPAPLNAQSLKPAQQNCMNWQYTTYNRGDTRFHLVTVPGNSPWQVIPAVSDKVETLDKFATRYHAPVVINAGFFDPNNQKTTSYIQLEDGQTFKPEDNERLVTNPNLQPYLPKILRNRPSLQQYDCGQTVRYTITLDTLNRQNPENCHLQNSLGAGPQLFTNDHPPTEQALKDAFLNEGFIDYNPTGKLTRDPIGVFSKNARSAIGLKPDGSILILMAAQTLNNKTGVSLPDLAKELYALGARQAMALDGGSSSALYVNHQVIYGKLGANNETIQRPVKSVLMIVPRP
jgi:exopolysaccharide biosynthesis protein